MRKGFAWLLIAVLLISTVMGAGSAFADGEEAHVYDDGRARPSNAGKLQVVDGKLCDEQGTPVMLRGVSSQELIVTESFLNEQLFEELSRDAGVNLFRLAVYTHGVGIIGYCTKGDRARYDADVQKGVELAKNEDMYVIIDWHILSDGDPNIYKEEAKEFFMRSATSPTAWTGPR